MLRQCLHQQPHSSTKLLPEEANCNFFEECSSISRWLPLFSSSTNVRSRQRIYENRSVMHQLVWVACENVLTRALYVEKDSHMWDCVKNVDFTFHFLFNLFPCVSIQRKESHVQECVFLMNLLNHLSGSTQNVFSHPAFISVYRCRDTITLWGCQGS